MSYFFKLMRASMFAALRGEWAVAAMYMRWARAQLPRADF